MEVKYLYRPAQALFNEHQRRLQARPLNKTLCSLETISGQAVCTDGDTTSRISHAASRYMKRAPPLPARGILCMKCTSEEEVHTTLAVVMPLAAATSVTI